MLELRVRLKDQVEGILEVDKAKQNKSFLKSQCDKFEEEVNAARRDVGAVAKEMQTANKVSTLANKKKNPRGVFFFSPTARHDVSDGKGGGAG